MGGGALLLAGLFFRFKRVRVADEDSPIIIKSGSLAVAVHDASPVTVDGSGKSYTIKTRTINKPKWIVTVAALEAGFPVSAPETIPDVSRVTLDLVDDDRNPVDTITITFAFTLGQGTLKFTATNDNDFGDRVRKRKIVKSKRHKVRAFHRKVRNHDDFEVSEITVTNSVGIDVRYPPTNAGGIPDYVIAFDFV